MRSVTDTHHVALKQACICFPALSTGPGAQCDGEDWFAISASPYLDYATVHVYERHLELLPVPNEGNPNWPNWNFCDFNCYVPWFRMYNQVGLAGQLISSA